MITARKVDLPDAKILFDWANEAYVRANSFSPEPILWDQHIAWLKAKLASPDSHIFLFFEEDEPIGQVRFDKIYGAFEIDYSVGRNKRGRGLGSLMLKLAIEKLIEVEAGQLPIQVFGQVKSSNLPSIKIFRSLGFNEQHITIEETNSSFYKFTALYT